MSRSIARSMRSAIRVIAFPLLCLVSVIAEKVRMLPDVHTFVQGKLHLIAGL